MSMMVSFVLSFFPRDVLDEILNLIESVSEDFPSYSYLSMLITAECDKERKALHVPQSTMTNIMEGCFTINSFRTKTLR